MLRRKPQRYVKSSRAAPEGGREARKKNPLPFLQAYFANIVALSEDAIISVGLDQRIRLFNQGAEVIFGYTEAEVRGLALDVLVPERSRAIHREHFARFAASDERRRPMNARQTIMGLRKDGTEFPAEATITQFTIAGETVLTVRLRDITANLKAEVALRQANEQLEHRVVERTAALQTTVQELQAEIDRRTAAEAKLRKLSVALTLAEQRERLRLAHILHDGLQQLLVAAQFRTTFLSRTPDPAAVQEHTDKLRELLTQALTASRSLTAELSPSVLQTGGLGPALEWLVQWMQQTHGLSVKLQMQTTEQPEAEALKVLLFQAVRELLFNVVKHAGVRQARVTVARSDEHLQVVVADQGQGFDPAHIPTASDGGLGLPSIRQRLEYLGGTLEMQSAPGQGSRFTLTVPLRPESTAAPAASTPQKVLRILVADDHQAVHQALAHLFGGAGDLKIVAEAMNGQEAVTLARQCQADVILMDLNMPVLDGIEATRQMTTDLPGIPVIGFSAFEDPDRAQAMRDAGAVTYVSKSAPAEEMLAVIRTWGNRSRAA